MIFNVLTLYPELIDEYAKTGVVGRGVKSGILSINSVNIRDYTLNKHGCVDDYPYGGGAGMIMMAQPVYDCITAVRQNKDIPVIFFSPKGRPFTTSIAKEYIKYSETILLCGHFEGIDQRALDLCVTDELSMGDYILTGGHLAAMCFIDAVSRYIPGVLGNEESYADESFENGLLEHAQYTRPYEFMGLKVPDILLSGNHAKIQQYKYEQSLAETKKRRPDLFDSAFSKQD